MNAMGQAAAHEPHLVHVFDSTDKMLAMTSP